MKRILTSVLAALVVVGAVAAGATVAQADSPPVDAPTGDDVETDDSESEDNEVHSPPGLHVSAAVGAMTQDIDNRLDRNALGHQLQQAETQDEKQRIIDEFVEEQKEQVADSSNASENRSDVRHGFERAMDVVGSQHAKENVEYAEEMAEQHDVNVDEEKLQTIKEDADEMTGEAVSELARGLVGMPENAANGGEDRAESDNAGEYDDGTPDDASENRP